METEAQRGEGEAVCKGMCWGETWGTDSFDSPSWLPPPPQREDGVDKGQQPAMKAEGMGGVVKGCVRAPGAGVKIAVGSGPALPLALILYSCLSGPPFSLLKNEGNQ